MDVLSDWVGEVSIRNVRETRRALQFCNLTILHNYCCIRQWMIRIDPLLNTNKSTEYECWYMHRRERNCVVETPEGCLVGGDFVVTLGSYQVFLLLVLLNYRTHDIVRRIY